MWIVTAINVYQYQCWCETGNQILDIVCYVYIELALDYTAITAGLLIYILIFKT
jgi:hypothetical protein